MSRHIVIIIIIKIDNNFIHLISEPCIFVRIVDGEVELIGLHVDDIIINHLIR
jgi:hypothetical protein